MIRELFLEALGASLRGEYVGWDMPLTTENWVELFQLAQAHHVLPMIYEAAYACPAARGADPRMMMLFKRQTMQSVMMQAMKTNEFFALMKHLQSAGLTPCVVKGIACRSLYPNPDHRMSGDEDVLIPRDQAETCHEAMLAFGMQVSEPEIDRAAAYEIPYGKPGSPIYIELHKSLFPPDSDAYGDLNRFFEDAHARAAALTVGGMTIATLNPTDHFFYLICHSFKHFLHSGFGLRQVCDIVLFANRWGGEIDWAQVKKNCEEIHALQFTYALLKIGMVHFGFDPAAACLPGDWSIEETDEGPMLSDLLDSGVYGDATMSRKHSSTMTLSAVTADKQGKKGKRSILRTLFPRRDALIGRYPYLKSKPYLLPAAWASRIIGYARRRGKQNDNTAESLRIASERIELMRKYGIIK
ncbi:MAG: nucleotidyltransferase family protein [Clostridia bacterium]|nr:nucleotidyltransferase family protein [Clostridia bacterium]